MRFSIIVPARKISDFLKESITHLKQLDYEDFEVLIITDNLEKYDFGGDSRFKLISSEGSGNPGYKRNLAASIATGQVLVFLDDDAYPQKDWLKEAYKLFQDPKMYALGGPAVTPPKSVFLEKLSGYILQSPLASGGTVYRHIPMPEREIDDYPTVNLFVLKEAFDKIGGFGIEFWPGEDTKLCLDLIKLYGYNFKYSPKPVVFHHRRLGLKNHLKQVSRYGRHRGQYARIFPENSRVLSYFIPSIFVVGLIFGPILYFISTSLFFIYKLVLYIYFALILSETIKLLVKEKNPLIMLYVPMGIFLTHIIYGANFIIGFIKRPKLKLKAVDSKSGNYSEG